MICLGRFLIFILLNSIERKLSKIPQKIHFLTLLKELDQKGSRYLNIFFMNSHNSPDQDISINVNLSLKDETLRMLIEMANDMDASLEDVISSITEDSVIDLEILQDDLGIVIIPEKCSKQDLMNSIQ